MDTSFSVKSTIVAEDLCISLLPKSKLRTGEGQCKHEGRGRKNNEAEDRRGGTLKSERKEGFGGMKGRRKRKEEQEERAKDMPKINLLLFSGCPV